MNKSVLQINSQYMPVGSMCVDLCGIYTVYYLILDFIKITDLLLMINWCVLRIIYFNSCE